MAEILCPKCHNHIGHLTPFRKKDDKHILRLFCSSCEYYMEVDERDYEWEFKCPFCGHDIYDIRGAAYAQILAGFIGGCGRPGCPGPNEVQEFLETFDADNRNTRNGDKNE